MWRRPSTGMECDRRSCAAVWPALIAVLAGACLCVAAATGTAPESDPRLAELRRLLAERNFDEAVAQGRQYLVRVQSEHGADSLLAALVIDTILEGSKFHGPTAEVRALGERAVAIKRADPGAGPATLADSLFHLGTLLIGADLEAAQGYLVESLALRRAVVQPDGEVVGRTLGNLSIVAARARRKEEALALRLEALATLERALGPDHLKVATSLNNLAVQQWELGRYRESLDTQRRALAIYERQLPDDDRAVSRALINMGSHLWKAGRFSEARAHYERCLAAVGPQSGLVSLVRNNLGEVYASQGDWDAARSSFEQALRLREERYGPQHRAVAETMGKLGDLERQAGNLELARQLLERSTAISPSPEAVIQLGQVWQALDETEAALQAFRRAQALIEEDQADHPLLAVALGEEARTLIGLGRSAAAAPLLERALPLLEQAYGSSSPFLADTLVLTGMVRRDSGRPDRALEALLRAEILARDHARLTARSLSEREALLFARVRATGLPEALAIVADGAPPAQRSAVLDQLIRSRGIVLDEMARRHRLTQVSDDAELKKLSRSLAEARVRLAHLLVRGAVRSAAADHRRLVLEAVEEKDGAELALARASRGFRDELERGRLGLEAVSGALPAQSALVALVRYTHRTPATADLPSSTRDAYLAFVLRGGTAEPVVVRLGAAHTIDRMIADWRAELGSRPPALKQLSRRFEQRCRELGRRVRQALWDPLAGPLGESKRVFLVPDAALHVLNFATLPVGDDGWLVEQDREIHYLSTERDLVRPHRPPTDAPGLLALGGPEFDSLPAATGGVAAARDAGDITDGGSELVFRGSSSSCREFTKVRFDPLPRAEEEVLTIGRQWAGPDAALRPLSMLTGARADESTFKREAAKWEAIHVATHGFFFDDPCLESEDRQAPEHPLRLSGLALAGANRRNEGRLEGEDGILTAEEIASMDLGGVDWVVLSGCRTGVGAVRPGEGVFGLRRAFEIAGADTLIMSLWPVEDDSARRWMEALYRHRLAGATTATAVAAATREILHAKRGAGLSEHPFYWGAFVATGDWR